MLEDAARKLSSRIANGTLSGDLARLYSRVDSNELDSASVIPLVEQILRNEPDAPTWSDGDIWHAVFEFVAHASPTPTTPPTAIENTVVSTPARSTSASQ